MRPNARPGVAVTRLMSLVVSLALFPLALGNSDLGAQEQGAAEQTVVDPVKRALAGAIDIHVHAYPDMRGRSQDVFEAAIMARTHGMRGLVLKNHYDQTGGFAYLVRRYVPGVEVFGGVDLNLTQGGMNPHAVEHMTQLNGGFGKVVWMSTNDAEASVVGSKGDRPFVSVAKDGVLLPETKAVIAVIAKHQLAMATGHTSPEEGLLLVKEGKRQGVKGMVITHPASSWTVDQMKAAAREGAFLEYCGSTLLPASAAARMDKFAKDIRELGIQNVILSSDLGRDDYPLPTDGFAAFILALKARGYTDVELDTMAKDNPAKLLGLPLLKH
jgi:hypothetical protein